MSLSGPQSSRLAEKKIRFLLPEVAIRSRCHPARSLVTTLTELAWLSSVILPYNRLLSVLQSFIFFLYNSFLHSLLCLFPFTSPFLSLYIIHSLFSFPPCFSRFPLLTFLCPWIWYLSVFRSFFLCLFLVCSFESVSFLPSADCFLTLIYHCFSFFCASILCFHLLSMQCCLSLSCTTSCNFRPEA